MSTSDENPGPDPAATPGQSPDGPQRPGAPDPSAPELPEQAVPAEPPVVGSAVVRRVPRYRGFVVAGATLGAVVAILVVLLGPSGPEGGLGRGPVLVFLSLIGIVVAGVLGAVVAVLVERARR